MATVTVKVEYDDEVKVFSDAEATEERRDLVVKRGEKVIGRFNLSKVDRWYATDS